MTGSIPQAASCVFSRAVCKQLQHDMHHGCNVRANVLTRSVLGPRGCACLWPLAAAPLPHPLGFFPQVMSGLTGQPHRGLLREVVRPWADSFRVRQVISK